jgi:protoporphyrinogen oxidase
MAKIVIIGAGLTGLSTAYHLEKKGFTDFKIFEKESTIGGLCRSVQQDGFTFDYTGHLLHINDPYFKSLITTLVGFEHFNTIIRRSFIYSHNSYTRYPYQINLYGLPTQTIADCIEGFVKRDTSIKQPKSFKQWVLKNFGSGFAKHFFYSYQQKIFACNLNNISASWTGRFVPQTSLKQIIEGALHDKQDAIGYNAQFFYPKKGGIFTWVEKLAHAIKAPIYTEFCVEKINLKEKIIYFTNGHIEPFEQLVSTMPLDTMLRCLQEKSSTTFKRALDHLRCNSVINFNLGIDNPDLSDKHWIYYPEKQYPFYRIGFPHNFTAHATPPNCSSLYGEFAHIGKSQQWINQTLNCALAATKKMFNIADTNIVTQKIMHIAHAYVLYDFWRDKNLPKLLHRLKEHHIYPAGRYGEWKYASMQEGILDGKKLAESLIVVPAKKIYEIQQPKQREKHPSTSSGRAG